MYKLATKAFASDPQTIIRLVDGVESFIPPADDNPDYQAYLEWLAEGNTPEPAEQPPVPPGG